MSTSSPPKKNAAFTFFVTLVSQADTKSFQTNPTLAAGDVKVSIDGSALANLTTLPVVTPAGSKGVQVDLSASEMNGNNVRVIFSDVAGAEWCDLNVSIQTSVRQVDDLLPTASYTAPDNTTITAINVKTTNLPALPASTTNITAGTITTVTTLTNLPAITTDWLTAVGVKADAVTKIQNGLSTYAGGAVASVTAAVTVGTNNDKTGYSLAASQHVIVDSGTVTNVTNAPTAGDFTATMKTSLNAATPAVTVSDKTGFSLSSAGVQAIWDALTTALTTVGSVGKKLADWVIGTAQTGDSYARIGSAGAGLTALGDARLAHLDVDVSSRMATFVYTTPPTAVAIRTEIDSNSVGLAAIFARTDVATSTRMATFAYTAPDNASVATILSRVTGTVVLAESAPSWYSTPVDVSAGIATIVAKTNLIPASPASVSDIPTLTQIFTTALTESYATVNGAFSIAQALYEISSNLSEVSIVGTVGTFHKRDHTTAAGTFALDSGASPTSRRRAT